MSTSARRLAPVVAAVAVLALVLGVVALLRAAGPDPQRGGDGSPGSPDDGPSPLALTDYQLPAPGSPVESRFRLAGDLPDSAPEQVRLQRLGDVDPGAAAALAGALGLRGPGHREGAWTVWGAGDASLRVSSEGQWEYAAAGCPAAPRAATGSSPAVSADGSTGTAAPDASVSSAGCLPPPVPAKPSSGTAPPADTAAAERVLRAAGLPGHHEVRPVPGTNSASVLAVPVVAGLPTAGLPSVVRVTGDRVTDASGWLAAPRPGAAYPVISARAAWERLRHTLLPQTLIACTVPEAAGTDPLLCGGPVEVTGAQLGLSAQHLADGRTVLVPAWLFEIRGRDQAYPVVALPDRLLRPGASDLGAGGSGSSGAGSGSASAPPSTAVSPSPGGGPLPAPGKPGSRFQDVRVSGPRTLTVQFTGGVAACYDYRVVAQETATRVRLVLTEAVTSDRACIDLAQVYDRTVTLQAPLAGRTVVDAESGTVLVPGTR